MLLNLCLRCRVALAFASARFLGRIRPTSAFFQSLETTDQKYLERLVQIIDLVKLQAAPQVRRNIAQIGEVLLREDDVLDARAFCAQDFLFKTADGEYPSAQGDLARRGDVLTNRDAGQGAD